MKEKIRAGKKIRIISDYDVDGITSNYILYQGLQKAGQMSLMISHTGSWMGMDECTAGGSGIRRWRGYDYHL